MYLKRIEMRGFKSFADKTVVEFQEGVTCVVGPNGSGKSNITDAVRWVLGEQRPKTLRGSKMEDVIFNGTKQRKSLGLAEVTLVFDNTAHFFPLEYEEIAVTRRVHRSGEGEYWINQMPCRLKDIRELFMDTGIGREGYSIIGQGRIDEILSQNKDERRMIFEEAAGIVKFKSRKSETERKLKATGENLDRILDILSEIEVRIEPLRAESEKAKRYLSLSESIRNIELKEFSTRYQQCESATAEVKTETDSHRREIEILEGKLRDYRAQYDADESALYALKQSLHNMEDELHEATNKESRMQGERQVLQEKIDNAELNIQRLLEESEEMDQSIKALESALEAFDEEYMNVSRNHENMKLESEAIQLKYTAAGERIASMRAGQASDRSEAIQLLNAIEVKKNDRERTQQYLISLDEKIQAVRSDSEKQKSAILDNDNEAGEMESAHTVLSEEQEALAHEKSELQARRKLYREQDVELELKIDQSKQEVSKVKTECDLLKQMEQDFSGYDQGVKAVLKHLGNTPGFHGVLASLIEVPKAYEVAIEVALGRAIQNIVCEKISDAKVGIDYLRKNNIGRVTFLPLENFDRSGEMEGAFLNEAGVIGLASRLVTCDDAYSNIVKHLLGRTLIVDRFETAARLIQDKKFPVRVITLKGDVLIPGGAITGGSYKSRMSNVLGRKRRISDLETETVNLRASLDKMIAERATLMEIIQENEQKRTDLEARESELNLEKVRLENALENLKQWRNANLERQEKLASDYEALLQEKQLSEEALMALSAEIDSAQERVDVLERGQSVAKESLDAAEREMNALSDAAMSLKIELASLEQTMAFKQRERKRTESDLKSAREKYELRLEQSETFAKQRNIFKENLDALTFEIESLSGEKGEMHTAIQEKNRLEKDGESALKVLGEGISELMRGLDGHKEAMHRIDVKSARLEAEKEAVVSELWERYDMSIGQAMLVEAIEHFSKSDIRAMKQELKDMGPVNVKAPEEYAAVSERYTFMNSQREDLAQAADQLKKVILDLEKQMTRQFKHYFETISKNFEETFKVLFGGGVSELILADEDDVLNCDIDIIAQPPGKKLQSINLLSGGEKALTAIALLFAILNTKPSPFCILDEIEAALDDVNVQRFASFIKNHADRSQFVIITHRKGTMEVAEALYGVTMEEYGISKILSVKLEDAQETMI
ncbi:MAG: chromosome segregation protein [Clostridiales bacterium]|nr:chromosome segregation protein [Clostridiales bacterium]